MKEAGGGDKNMASMGERPVEMPQKWELVGGGGADRGNKVTIDAD